MPSDFFQKRLRSFIPAFQGIAACFRGEPNTWIHLFFTVLAICAGVLFKISSLEWALIFVVIGFVWAAELINTAIETNVNLYTKVIHPLAKKSKDLAAGAVLIAAITSVIVGLLIFLPKFIALFS